MKVLFVCLGNICRSPVAEAVFQHLIEKHNMQEQIQCDSAGTSAYHEGEPAHPISQETAAQRGYNVTSRSRPLCEEDFYQFDLILTMDQSNYKITRDKAPDNSSLDKVKPFASYLKQHNIDHVPDPYKQGEDGFELVLDILEDGCQNCFDYILSTIQN